MISVVKQLSAKHNICRLRAVIAVVLLGAWIAICAVLFHLSLAEPETSRDIHTARDAHDEEGRQRESILAGQGHSRRESTELSVSLVDGRCAVTGTQVLQLAREDPLFTALQAGTPPIGSQYPLGDLRLDYGSFYFHPSSQQDAIRMDKDSSTATVIYEIDSTIPSGQCSSLEIGYACTEYCPPIRSFTLTVGPELSIGNISEGTPDSQGDDRVTFISLAPQKDIKVSLDVRDPTAVTYPNVVDDIFELFDEEIETDPILLLCAILIPPLVIFGFSRTRREYLDRGSRAAASVAICSAVLIVVTLGLDYWLPVGVNVPSLVPALFETAFPSLVLLALLSIFVALPLVLSMLVARSHNPVINRSFWILVVSIASGPAAVVAVIQSGDYFDLHELTLAIIVVILPILVIAVLFGANWDLLMASGAVGFITALFATSIFPGNRINILTLLLAFSLVAAPLCALSAGRLTERAAFPSIVMTMMLTVELAWYTYLIYDDEFGVYYASYIDFMWAAFVLQVLEFFLFFLLIGAMIGRSSTVASVSSVITVDGRCVVMYLLFVCTSVNYILYSYNVGIILAVVLSTLLFGFFVIRESPDARGALWGISNATHKRLVTREARRRTVFKVSRDHARTGKSRISEGICDLHEFDKKQRIFDQQSDPRQSSGIASDVSLPEAALGSVAGFTPRQNARAASVFALIVCFPVVLPELAGFWLEGPSAGLGVISTFRWIIYACIFGYYYPIIRGTSPTSKSFVLFMAVAISEVILLSGQLGSTGELAVGGELAVDELVLPVALRLGQAAVLCFGLGLFWELRLVQAAGLGWGRIRDFRALRGLATPVVTVAIAAATTIATGIAGATLTSIVQPSDNSEPAVPSTTPELDRK